MQFTRGVRAGVVAAAAVAAAAAATTTAAAFPEGTRFLLHSAAHDACVYVDTAPRAGMQLKLTPECNGTAAGQRFHFQSDTLRSDIARNKCVTTVGKSLALRPCKEGNRAQKWTPGPLRANDAADHLRAADKRGGAWQAGAHGAIEVRPARSGAAQEWKYIPVR